LKLHKLAKHGWMIYLACGLARGMVLAHATAWVSKNITPPARFSDPASAHHHIPLRNAQIRNAQIQTVQVHAGGVRWAMLDDVSKTNALQTLPAAQNTTNLSQGGTNIPKRSLVNDSMKHITSNASSLWHQPRSSSHIHNRSAINSDGSIRNQVLDFALESTSRNVQGAHDKSSAARHNLSKKKLVRRETVLSESIATTMLPVFAPVNGAYQKSASSSQQPDSSAPSSTASNSGLTLATAIGLVFFGALSSCCCGAVLWVLVLRYRKNTELSWASSNGGHPLNVGRTRSAPSGRDRVRATRSNSGNLN